MENRKYSRGRIEINYAAVQGTYWVSFCVINGFSTVYLSARGLTNTQIGFTTSFIFVAVILLQIVLGDFCDRHDDIPLKRVLSALFTTAVLIAGAMELIPMQAALMTVAFGFASAFVRSTNGIVNAQMMQFVNAGCNVRYGWQFGAGSITYAVCAYVMGILIDKYTTAIMMPVFIASSVITVACILFMPLPPKRVMVREANEKIAPEKVPSYAEMLSRNRPLVIFIAAAVLSSLGHNVGLATFLVRVVEALGGSNRELGVCMFIQSFAEVPMMFGSAFVLRHVKPGHLLIISFLADTLKVLLVSFARSFTLVYIALALSFLCYGIYGFAAALFVNSIVGDREKVRAQGFIPLTNAIGSIAGTAIAGVIIDSFSIWASMRLSAVLCFLSAAAMALCCRSISSKEAGGTRKA